MGFGIEIFDPSGRLIMDGTNRYARIIEVIDLSVVATPGFRDYPLADPASLTFVIYQGGNRARAVTVSGQRVSWAFANSLQYGVFGGASSLVVLLR